MPKKKKEEEKPVRETATNTDIEVAYSGPAFSVNRSIVSVGPAVRIGFLEQHPQGGPHFRTAVAMHPQDAISLYKLLREMLVGIEAQVEKAQAEMEAAQKDGTNANKD